LGLVVYAIALLTIAYGYLSHSPIVLSMAWYGGFAIAGAATWMQITSVYAPKVEGTRLKVKVTEQRADCPMEPPGSTSRAQGRVDLPIETTRQTQPGTVIR
jgi:hypothetical protein